MFKFNAGNKNGRVSFGWLDFLLDWLGISLPLPTGGPDDPTH